MAAEFFGAEKIVAPQWGDCIRRWPKQFWRGFFLGTAVLTAVAFGVVAQLQWSATILRPTLRLLSDEVVIGGYLGFIQGKVPRHRCPEETVRMVTFWENSEKIRKLVVPLPDFNVVPNLWDGESVVLLKLPDNIPPGEYSYQRETAQWCSLWNFVVGPTISRTDAVHFKVVNPPPLKKRITE